MGKKYMDTKDGSLESSILSVWQEAASVQEKKVAETNKNDKSDDGDGLDAVQPKAVKKKFDNRKDKDIDNDGDTDDSDEYLHKRRKAVSKAVKEDWMQAVVDQISRSENATMFSEKSEKDEGNAFGAALKAAKEKGDDTFVVAGKTYKCEDYDDEKDSKVTETGKKAAKVEINQQIEKESKKK